MPLRYSVNRLRWSLKMPYPVTPPGSTRRRLLDAAISQFEEAGFEATTVTDISVRAGVTTGALYHHFGSKLGLYLVIREEMERRMTERMEGAAAAMGEGRAGVIAALVVSFDAAVRFGASRILAEDPPMGAVDPIRATVLSMLPEHPVAADCLVSAWRTALMDVAVGATAESARSGLLWVLEPAG